MIHQGSSLQRDQIKRIPQSAPQMSISQQQQQQQQQYREALIARAKLNARKSFSVEDDFEFYPNFIETRQAKSQQHLVQQHQLLSRQSFAISAFTTPTKLSGLRLNQQSHSHSGFISPQVQQSPQQSSSQLHQNGVYNSPTASRRIDHQNAVPTSPMHQQHINW